MKIENKDLLDKIFSKSSDVSYSHFINLSLYDEDFGYYKNNSIPKDFLTSPTTHESFGKVMSNQIKEIWNYYDNPRQFTVVELGGNNGKLKNDILNDISKDKKFFNSIVYFNIDKINGDEINDVDFNAENGCIISNEFFDALPFNRFIKKNDEIMEIKIKLENNELVEVYKKMKKFSFFNDDVISKIPNGSVFEVINDLDSIIKKISSFFNNCVMVTIDYGFNDYNKLFLKNPNGLVRCYYNHSMDKNILKNIGEKDITCDVNFNYLNDSLGKFGLHKIANTTQEKFLIKNGFKKYFDNAIKNEEKRSLISLVNPDGLGGFHVYYHEKPKGSFSPSCLND